jgi:hypothetical protein
MIEKAKLVMELGRTRMLGPEMAPLLELVWETPSAHVLALRSEIRLAEK